jgi:predicted thioesterase
MDVNEYLQAGLSREDTFTIEEKHTAPHVGSGVVRVLGTPCLIAFMEITSRKLLDEHLPEGFSTVGVLVNVRHLAPSAIGSSVHVRVEVQEVDGNKVMLEVDARDGEDVFGKGLHERYVIDVQRFLKRVEGNEK